MKVEAVGSYRDFRTREIVVQLSCGCEARTTTFHVLSVNPREYEQACSDLVNNHDCPRSNHRDLPEAKK